MGSMTSSTSPVTATGPALFDSFGVPLAPGTSVGLVMMNKTPGFTFARGTVVGAGEQLSFDVSEYRDQYGQVVEQPSLSNAAAPMVTVLREQSAAFGAEIGLTDVFGSAVRFGDHAAFLLWDGAERVALGRGAVTGVHDGMVSLIANGSAVARVRDGQRVLAPSTTMFRLAL